MLLTAPEGGALKNRIGCLISEIVVPGWNPDQHQFISTEKVSSGSTGLTPAQSDVGRTTRLGKVYKVSRNPVMHHIHWSIWDWGTPSSR